MSADAAVTKDLMQTLEDGRAGFAKGAEKLATSHPEVASVFGQFSQQRATFADELRELAKGYGDSIDESSSVAGAVHRGWMTVKDALSGSDIDGVIDAAIQGEDHAVKDFEDALAVDDLSAELRTVVQRQGNEVRDARDRLSSLRDKA